MYLYDSRAQARVDCRYPKSAANSLKACFLMTLMERACQCQLLAEVAAANGIPKAYIIADESASTPSRARVIQKHCIGRVSPTLNTKSICAKANIRIDVWDRHLLHSKSASAKSCAEILCRACEGIADAYQLL